MSSDSPRSMKRRRQAAKAASHGVLVVVSILILVPLIWTTFGAFKSQKEFFASNRLIPREPTLENFVEAVDRIPFLTYFENTVVFTFGLLLVQLLTLTPAAYAFARLTFRGKTLLFYLLLTQLMIAPQSLVLPNYLTVRSLGLLDTRVAMMLPYFASAFGTFLLRQAFRMLPLELEDSAKMDGCGRIRFLLHIGIPLVRPSMYAFAIMSLVYHWSEFFWPFIVTDTPRARTLTIGLAMFAEQTRSGGEWNLLTAMTLLIIAPMLLVFLVFQRNFINSFMRSGIKS